MVDQAPMAHYTRFKRKKLGDILVDEGLATKEAVIAALHQQQTSGRLLSDILLDQREVNEFDLARVLVSQFQAPFLDLRGYSFHKDLIESFPAGLLHKVRAIPLDRFGKQVSFACQEVPSEENAALLREHAGGGLFFFIASSVEIRARLNEYAPCAEEEPPPPAAEEGEALPVSKLKEDSAWQSLFDAANEAILSEVEPGSEGAEED